ncbi:MAG: AraC family transcriptional regulator [Pseudomonadota bacterium]
MTDQLFVLPLPIITFAVAAVAAVTAALVWRVNFGPLWAHFAFTAFFILLALGSLLVGLRFGYGITALLPLQRAVPFFVGPLLYIGFRAFTVPDAQMMRIAAPHLLVAFAAPLIFLVLPPGLLVQDWLIGASSLFYGLLLLRLWTKGVDHLSFARLEMLPGLRAWALVAALFLVVSFAADLAISWAFSQARPDNAVQIISAGSLVILLSVIAVTVLLLRSSDGGVPKRIAPSSGDKMETAILEMAEELLLETGLYLDTELTVERLAKRLRMPARALSNAVNQCEGINVPQWVNGFRLRHAANLLLTDTASVAAIMEKSGFLTRSNFYREFNRAYGVSPAEYRQQNETID